MPNTCSALRPTTTLLLLCVASLVAIGCGNASPGLEDTARNISRRSAQLNAGMAGSAADEDAYAAATEEDQADDEDVAEDDMSDEGADDAADDATPAAMAAGSAGMGGLISDDSPRCGNKILDQGELCDVGIKAGEPGACPTECEQTDACHEGMLDLRTCWTQCVPGKLVDC
ncbi:MAG TPA: hypothetical protein VK509_11730 [Polyangiales bacterium]|nr:hypothetical protein [Polyangiales bacterium]